MYPHTLTAWHPKPEGRDVAWENRGTLRCRFDMERTITASTAGDDASWVASILIPTPCSDPPLERGDKVALGAHEGEPVKGAYKVTRCDPVSLNKAEPDHWEAEAR